MLNENLHTIRMQNDSLRSEKVNLVSENEMLKLSIRELNQRLRDVTENATNHQIENLNKTIFDISSENIFLKQRTDNLTAEIAHLKGLLEHERDDLEAREVEYEKLLVKLESNKYDYYFDKN